GRVLVRTGALVGVCGSIAFRQRRRSGAPCLQLAQARAARRVAGTASVGPHIEVRPAAPQLGRRLGAHALATLEPVDARVVDALLALLRPGREAVPAVRDRRWLLVEARLERGTDAGRRGAVLLASSAGLDACRGAIATELPAEREHRGGVLSAFHVVDPRGLEARGTAHTGERERRREEHDDRREEAHRVDGGDRLPLLEPVRGSAAKQVEVPSWQRTTYGVRWLQPATPTVYSTRSSPMTHGPWMAGWM